MKSTFHRFRYFFITIIVMVAVITMCDNDKSVKNNKPKTRKEILQSQFSSWDGSHYSFTRYIKNKMHDPDSYEHVETKYIDKDDYFIVYTSFRGKNKFGALVKNTISAKVDLKGNIIEVIE